MVNSALKINNFNGFKRRGNIWQLFNAMDFESLMFPCITFCRILGIFPYKINAYTIKTNKFCYFLSIIVICTLCISDLYTLYNLDYKVFYDHIYNITSVPDINDPKTPELLERNCFYIFGGFTSVITFFLSGSRMHILQDILEISSKLPQKSYKNLSELIHAKDILGFFLIIIQILIYYNGRYGERYDNISKALILYLHLLEFQMNMLYMNCVCVLKVCFKQINDGLMFFQKFMPNDEPSLLEVTYQKQKNPFQLLQLKGLIKQHQTISNTLEKLQATFRWQLLSTSVMTFIEITFNIYFLFERMQGQKLSVTNLKNHYDLIVFSINYSIKILLVVWACETGKDEAIEIKTSVHEVINNTSDEEIQSELKIFSLQLMQRDTVFCAKGLIVNAMLLTNVSD
ncbi:GR28B protein, partial [Acromyrmex charruanus]